MGELPKVRRAKSARAAGTAAEPNKSPISALMGQCQELAQLGERQADSVKEPDRIAGHSPKLPAQSQPPPRQVDAVGAIG